MSLFKGSWPWDGKTAGTQLNKTCGQRLAGARTTMLVTTDDHEFTKVVAIFRLSVDIHHLAALIVQHGTRPKYCITRSQSSHAACPSQFSLNHIVCNSTENDAAGMSPADHLGSRLGHQHVGSGSSDMARHGRRVSFCAAEQRKVSCPAGSVDGVVWDCKDELQWHLGKLRRE
jgi:hypothetical protein